MHSAAEGCGGHCEAAETWQYLRFVLFLLCGRKCLPCSRLLQGKVKHLVVRVPAISQPPLWTQQLSRVFICGIWPLVGSER